ncbi:MAG: hypothetical protein HYY18_02610 [Planctomycetes bacterium]|nr:hypothetical protein [Planctomycetota bacterium]
MRTRFLALALLLASAIPSRADESALRTEIAALEKQVATWTLLDALQLTREQAEQLWPLVNEANSLARAWEDRISGIHSREIFAFTLFRVDDMAGNGLDPEVERAAAIANHDEESARKRFLDSLATIEERAAAILTPAQRDLVASRGDGLRAVKARMGGNVKRTPGEMPEDVADAVSRIRRVSDEQYPGKRDSLRATLERLLGWSPREEPSMGAYVARVNASMDAIRRLPEGQLAARAPRLLEEARPKSEAERLRGELREIHKDKYGAAGALGMLLANALTRNAVGLKFGMLEGPATVPQRQAAGQIDPEAEAEIRRLRTDINLLNLANGMYFTPHQMRHIHDAAEKMQDLIRPATAREADLRDYRDALADVLACVEKGQAIPQKTLDDAQDAEKRVRQPKGRRRDPQADVAKLVKDVDGILTPAQREVLTDYKACLIPPKDLKNPVRVGQAHDNKAAVQLLERMRGIPAKAWAAKRDDIVERVIAESEERKGKFPGDERAAVRDRLAALCERARGMDAADFELEKSDLADELEFLDRGETVKQRLAEMAGEDEVVNGKIRAFLLDPAMAEVMHERLEMMRAKPGSKSVNLDDVEKAPSCKDGGCAVKD